MSRLKKCSFFLFSALLFCSTKSFAEDTKNTEENVENSLKELEDAEYIETPSYSSTIHFTLPIRLGINYPLKNNDTVGQDKPNYALFGSNTFAIPFFVNFPFGGHFVLSVGPEIEFSSFCWDGKRELADIKIFKEDEDAKTVKEVQKGSVDSTTFNYDALNLVVKFRFNFDKFDPTDGFYVELSGGVGFKFWAELEQKMKEEYDGTQYSFSGNDTMLGLGRLNAFAGIEFGYQRFGLFYRQHFTPVFNSEKVNKKKICSFPFCAGLAFNLI